MIPLPVAPAHALVSHAEERRWLVDGLWSEEAVGIIGSEPKCCKSFLALDLAVCVAAGTPCLRRFAVHRPGRVLLYAAEDAPHIVRRRLDGICAAAGLDLADLDVQVITAPSLSRGRCVHGPISRHQQDLDLEETSCAVEVGGHQAAFVRGRRSA